MLAVADHRDGPAGRTLSRLRLLLVVLGHDAVATRARDRRIGWWRTARSGPSSLVDGDREQRRLSPAALRAPWRAGAWHRAGRNIAAVAANSGAIRTVSEFFGATCASAGRRRAPRRHPPRQQRARARPRPRGFVDGIRTVLKPDGVAVIEVPYVRDMLDHCRIRHDLPRAPVLLLADGARSAVCRARPASFRRRAARDPRRQPAAVRLACRCRAGRGAAVEALLREEQDGAVDGSDVYATSPAGSKISRGALAGAARAASSQTASASRRTVHRQRAARC